MKYTERGRISENPEITTTEAARRLGLTQQAIGQWATKPGAPIRADGRKAWVRWPDFARWREQYLVDAAAAKAAPTASLDDARTRKALAEAELAELEVAKARGEWVSVKDSGDALGRALDIVAARLRSLGPSFSRFGPEVEAAAEAEAERIVTELHGWDGDVLDEPEQAAA